MSLLKGKAALITGASRGIGRAIALTFAQQGADVAFTYFGSADKAQSLCKEIETLQQKAVAIQANAADFEKTQEVLEQTLQTFGKIDICVNNAGISKDGLLLRLSPEQWDNLVQTNLNGVFYMTKRVIPVMMKQRNGSIINMSSIVGVKGNAGQSAYAATKAGVIGFTKSVAQELGARNIRCNALAPGFIQTDMTQYLETGGQMQEYIKKIPLQRGGTPQDVADAALFLASDLSRYITGQTLSVCGGMSV